MLTLHCIICISAISPHELLLLLLQIPVGRESINHYRSMCRSPVFSHDELVCKMMAQPSRLELCLLLITGQDSARMVQLEGAMRAVMETKVRVCVCVRIRGREGGRITLIKPSFGTES